MLVLLLLMNLSSYWLYHKSGGNTSLLFIWLLLCLVASYAWVERSQALTWWQLLGHSLRGGLWLPFSGLLAFHFWRYSWQPPSHLLDQFLNQRWQILPVLFVVYLGLVGLTAYSNFSWRFVVVAKWLLALLLLAGSLLVLQWGSDHLGGQFSRFSARLLWLLWLNGKYVLWLGLLLQLRGQRLSLDYRWASAGLLVALLYAWPLSGEFFALKAAQPQIIAHRGVNQSGVQNTISALQHTAPAHPNFVEIDLRLTADQQFIVSHDANTRQLTGKSELIAQTKLTQLQRLQLTEKGQQAHYASFTDYLHAAKQVHQPLLIELKVPTHVAEVTTDFARQFRTKLPAITQFHSTSLPTVERLRQRGLTPVGYILPFTVVGLPATPANFYSVDWRTLNPLIVAQARQQHKPLYVWTVDHAWALQAVRHLGATQVITDQTTRVRQRLQQPAGYTANLALLLANF